MKELTKFWLEMVVGVGLVVAFTLLHGCTTLKITKTAQDEYEAKYSTFFSSKEIEGFELTKTPNGSVMAKLRKGESTVKDEILKQFLARMLMSQPGG